MDIHVQHLASLCQICGDEIEDHKRKVDTIKPLCFWNSWNLERFIVVGFSKYSNNQIKKANFNCKWCISLLIEHALIIWDNIKALQVLQRAKKHQMREVNTKQHKKNKKN